MIGGEFFSTVFINPDMLVENGVAEKKVWKWASLVSDALKRSIVIRSDHISTFPGHSVLFCGNISLVFQNGAKELNSPP